ncbi:hypothetical protein ZWY2020_057363 [Hordeum vulgare]|nr:hypothetical protein ZWY2020_057363 [Hordeum vulgare]
MTMDDLIAPDLGHPPEAPSLHGVVQPRPPTPSHASRVAAIQRAGFLYGRVDTETKEVMVDFIYESPQQGSSDVVQLMRDANEEVRVNAIADGLDMSRWGSSHAAVGRKAETASTPPNSEVACAAYRSKGRDPRVGHRRREAGGGGRRLGRRALRGLPDERGLR